MKDCTYKGRQHKINKTKVMGFKRKKMGKLESGWEWNPGPSECKTRMYPEKPLQLHDSSQCIVAFNLEMCVKHMYGGLHESLEHAIYRN